jgi:hypothetical protein
MTWWWQLIRELLPLSWLLIPAAAVAFVPTQYVRPVAIAAGIFYAALIVVGYMTEDAVCGSSGAACLFVIPAYLLGVILTGIAFVVRASRASRKR